MSPAFLSDIQCSKEKVQRVSLFTKVKMRPLCRETHNQMPHHHCEKENRTVLAQPLSVGHVEGTHYSIQVSLNRHFVCVWGGGLFFIDQENLSNQDPHLSSVRRMTV